MRKDYSISVTQLLHLLQRPMKHFSILFLLLATIACKEQPKLADAQSIVDQAIVAACNDNCEHATIDFTFRDRCYVSKRQGGRYQFERITHDSTGITRDVLTNDGFERYHNGQPIVVADTMAVKYANSVNSVHYFAQLPYGLNAPAARKTYLGEAVIDGNSYHEIEVRFSEEGGGKDFEDVFVYWIRQDNYLVDYFAYSYATDNGGIRFREAFNPRVIEGIRFVDYRNYKPMSLDVPLQELDAHFMAGDLKLLSTIETEAVGVALKGAL